MWSKSSKNKQLHRYEHNFQLSRDVFENVDEMNVIQTINESYDPKNVKLLNNAIISERKPDTKEPNNLDEVANDNEKYIEIHTHSDIF